MTIQRGDTTLTFMHPGFASGDYFQPQFIQNAQGIPATAATVSYLPFFVPHDLQVNRFSIWLQLLQTGAAMFMGVYDTNATTKRPGSLIASTAEVDLSTGSAAWKDNDVTAFTLYRGQVYWACCHMKNVATQATVLINSSSSLSHPLIANTQGIIQNSNVRGLASAVAYPASLPLTAAAATPSSSASLPVFAMRVV
jgi:hypothetical protein